MLIRPGLTTRRVTALIESEIILSQAAKASWMPCLARTSSPMRSLSKVTTALDNTDNSLSAVSACSLRRFPSNSNGMVAKITTKAPSSRAMRAISGAAPEPVPPPRPTHRKTSCLPRSASRSSSSASSAARAPISGSPPAPSPLVRFLPK